MSCCEPTDVSKCFEEMKKSWLGFWANLIGFYKDIQSALKHERAKILCKVSNVRMQFNWLSWGSGWAFHQLAFSWTTEVDWKSAFWSQLKTFVNKRNQPKVYEVSFKWLKTTTVDRSESPQVNWNRLKSTEPVQSTWVGFSWLEAIHFGRLWLFLVIWN